MRLAVRGLAVARRLVDHEDFVPLEGEQIEAAENHEIQLDLQGVPEYWITQPMSVTSP